MLCTKLTIGKIPGLISNARGQRYKSSIGFRYFNEVFSPGPFFFFFFAETHNILFVLARPTLFAALIV